jgi:GNAT superfamily N-acetyltransferase
MLTNIKTKTIIRPFKFADAPKVINLFNAYSQDLFGTNDSDLDDLMNDWTSPGINVEEVIRVVENENREIIGYIDVWDASEPHVIKYVWGILHPEHWDEELFKDMLAWAENCARNRINLAPHDARVAINHGTPSKDTQRNKALLDYGYQLIRHFYRMQIELTSFPMEPTLPQGLRIETIDMETELKKAIIAMEDGFSDHWGFVPREIDDLMEHWVHYIENDKDFEPDLWYLAKDGDEIAGICRCSDKITEDPDMSWVAQLCVRKPWRRQGLGLAMLLTAFQEFYSRGKQRVGLGVDASSLTNATRLYEKAGMHVSRQYDTYQLELRPGEELARTQL